MITLSKRERLYLSKKLPILFLVLPLLPCILITISSCTTKNNDYRIFYDGNSVIVKNNKGSISFPIVGEVNVEGSNSVGELMPGSLLTMVANDEDKDQEVLFVHSLEDSTLRISTTTVYKRDCVIEYDGIIGKCEGDIGFIRDENVFVCGNPVLVGYTDKTKESFAICPEYGSLTPFYSKLEERLYKTKTIKAGDTLSTTLVIFNNRERPIRLLCQPNGYCATFTIASHADIANSLVTRAILWGTSDTTSVDYGKKGMLSNGIIGTMSVFAKHTEQYRAAEALEVPFFKNVVDKAFSQGMEICPHTISWMPDNRAEFEKYLPLFDENYQCRNWIDHYLRTDNISSGLHSAGWDAESSYYVMDLLQTYGYQYCWSYIDTPTENEEPDDQLWSGHYMFPRHLVYQNEHLSFPDGTMMYQYKNAWEQLNKAIAKREYILFHKIVKREYDPIQLMGNVIDNCGVWTDHSYLSSDWYKLYEQDNKKLEYRILPKLEAFFEYLKVKKADGYVWNPTMSEFCDHMVNLENIGIHRLSRGKYQIVNNGNQPVNCSFFYKGNGLVTLNGKPMQSKQVKNGMVCWGNIEVGDDNELVIK